MDKTIDRPEVFLALIAPIGIDLGLVETELALGLRRVSYKPKVIKLTDFLREHPEWFDLNPQSEFEVTSSSSQRAISSAMIRGDVTRSH